MIKSNSILNIVLIVSLITGVFLRLYNINHDNLWIDEMATFWVTDPSISFKEMLDRHSATELAPQFYYILIYFIHNIFGYSPDIARYFSSVADTTFGLNITIGCSSCTIANALSLIPI